MKNTKIFLLAGLAALGFSACSLDRTSQDPSVNMNFEQDAVFTKVYATLGTTGQKGPDGNGDVDGIDEGTSAFYRMFWELNEFPTDEGWWIWNDVGLSDTRVMTWAKDNSLVAGLYYRFYFDITLCNHFLDQTDGMTDEKTKEQRAEVRFIRAFNYYCLLDMFYSVPFTTTLLANDKEKDADFRPYAKTRPELYAWLETELLDIEKLLPAAGDRKSVYRVDQAAAWTLLMRMYLNSVVYNESAVGALDGKAEWDKAAEYAAKLMKSPYQLLTGDAAAVDDVTGKVTYSAYQKLFMGDNDNNGAQKEAIFMIYQDANYCQSWGGARFLVNTFRDASFVPSGSSDSWSCFRTSPEFVYYWVDKATAATVKADEYHMPAALGDDRAIMISACDSVPDKEWTLAGNQEADFYASWSVVKFTGIYSTSENPNVWTSPVGEPSWPDTDIPLFRVAEAYLTYAEAVFRGGAAVNGTAEDAIKALRDRAHNTEAFTLSTDFLLTEWAKEFYCEGRRRTDLIRFGQFAGKNTTLSWEGHKAGSKEAKYNVYPVPLSDEIANPNLAGINASINY